MNKSGNKILPILFTIGTILSCYMAFTKADSGYIDDASYWVMTGFVMIIFTVIFTVKAYKEDAKSNKGGK